MTKPRRPRALEAAASAAANEPAQDVLPAVASAPSALPEEESLCEACQRPRPLCLCAYIRPVETRTRVLILQHPREPDRELGTARITNLCLPRSSLRVGLSWPNLRAALGEALEEGRDFRPKEWAVLYLGSFRPRKILELGGEMPRADSSPLLLLDRHGLPRADSARVVRTLRGLVVLDGNWPQSKSLWWRNAWLLKLHRAVLLPGAPSLFGRLRREPRRESLSTLEAVARSLVCIEGRPGVGEALLAPFRALLEAYAKDPTEVG